MTKNVLIIELNEFNAELLSQATQEYPLPHLAQVLSLPRTHYKTNDRYNSGFLEPWVQWVSIHSGSPSSQHQVKHLGDVPDLQFEQCWETLSQHQISSGIWGVMNGQRREAKEVGFFLPDPWTFCEAAHPQALNHLIDLPRYVSKNYQNLSKISLIFKACKLLKFIFTSNVCKPILKETLQLLKDLKRYGKHHFVYISYFDYISTLLFSQYKKQFNPQCAILFLNSLAHLQHHHWTSTATISPQILHGLKYIDKILGYLKQQFPDDALIVHNGLSQMNTNHERPWVLYRQKDPATLFKTLNLPILKIEQHMTHDGHAFFSTNDACSRAFTLLKNATIQGKLLFHVEINAHDPCKLFLMLKYTDDIQDKSIEFTYDGKQFPFFAHFDRIVTRTGRHIPIGTVFSDTIKFEDQIYNHDFNQAIFHYFLPELFTMQKDIDVPKMADALTVEEI